MESVSQDKPAAVPEPLSPMSEAMQAFKDRSIRRSKKRKRNEAVGLDAIAANEETCSSNSSDSDSYLLRRYNLTLPVLQLPRSVERTSGSTTLTPLLNLHHQSNRKKTSIRKPVKRIVVDDEDDENDDFSDVQVVTHEKNPVPLSIKNSLPQLTHLFQNRNTA